MQRATNRGGRVTPTPRPPRATVPRSVPCRTWERSVSCFPRGPARSVASSSISDWKTCRTTTLTDGCRWRLEHTRSLGLPVRSRGTSEIVDIPPGYDAFSSEGSGTWSTDLTPILTPGQPFGDGTYLVGSEIAPGRYRTISSSDSCSWQITGEFGRYTEWVPFDAFEIRTAGSSVVVDIRPGDLAFRSYGCGTWSDDLTPLVAPRIRQRTRPTSGRMASASRLQSSCSTTHGLRRGKTRIRMSNGGEPSAWWALKSYSWSILGLTSTENPTKRLDA